MIAVKPYAFPLSIASEGPYPPNLAWLSSSAVNAPYWDIGITYGLGELVTYKRREYTSAIAGNVGASYGDSPENQPTKWTDIGPSNKYAMLDTSPQTKTVVTGPGAVTLNFTISSYRANTIALLGLTGTDIIVSVTDGTNPQPIWQETRKLTQSNGTYYGFCFDPFSTVQELVFTGFPSPASQNLTVSLSGTYKVSVGMCVIGKSVDIGAAQYGFSLNFEDRGRSYLDSLGNPVQIDRGYSKGCSGTLTSTRDRFATLMQFYSDNISTPCLWVAAPDQADLVAATVFGKISRVTPAIANHDQITTNIEISGFR